VSPARSNVFHAVSTAQRPGAPGPRTAMPDSKPLDDHVTSGVTDAAIMIMATEISSFKGVMRLNQIVFSRLHRSNHLLGTTGGFEQWTVRTSVGPGLGRPGGPDPLRVAPHLPVGVAAGRAWRGRSLSRDGHVTGITVTKPASTCSHKLEVRGTLSARVVSLRLPQPGAAPSTAQDSDSKSCARLHDTV
jgi:hypothetical protein